MNRIAEAANNLSEETAKEAYGQCQALARELAGNATFKPLQKLYFEAELESCFAYAMNNGKFSDETGDSCRHHYAFATKLADVITQGQGQPGYSGELMQMMGDRLERAGEIGPDLGCKGDYAAFAPAVALAKQAAAISAPEPDLGLLDEIGTITGGITEANAKDMQASCEAVRPKVAEKPGRPEAESAYIIAHIEGCTSLAMERGKLKDASGDACSHHYAAAQNLATAYKASLDDPLYAGFAEVFRAESEGTVDYAAQLGCTQDFKALLAN
jgi:hypothetical protein